MKLFIPRDRPCLGIMKVFGSSCFDVRRSVQAESRDSELRHKRHERQVPTSQAKANARLDLSCQIGSALANWKCTQQIWHTDFIARLAQRWSTYLSLCSAGIHRLLSALQTYHLIYILAQRPAALFEYQNAGKSSVHQMAWSLAERVAVRAGYI